MSAPCPKLTCQVTDSVEYYLGVYSLQSPEINPFVRKSEVLDPALCALLSCPVKDDLDYYLGQYSLQNGFFFYAVDFGVTNLPPGSYISVPPNPLFISKQGCISMVTLPVPFGSTPAQIEAIAKQVMQQVAAQKVICDTPAPPGFPNNPPTNPPPGGGGYTTYSNSAQSTSGSCPPGLFLVANGSLTGGLTLVNGVLTTPAGLFTSTVSQAAANAVAQTYMADLIADGTLVQCGWCNSELTRNCPDGTPSNIPAGVYCSNISQADADAQALAASELYCAGLMITMIWDSATTQGGLGASSASPAGARSSVTVRGECPNNVPFQPGNTAYASNTDANPNHGGFAQWKNPCSTPLEITCVTQFSNAGTTGSSPMGRGQAFVVGSGSNLLPANPPANYGGSVSAIVLPGQIIGVGISVSVGGGNPSNPPNQYLYVQTGTMSLYCRPAC